TMDCRLVKYPLCPFAFTNVASRLLTVALAAFAGPSAESAIHCRCAVGYVCAGVPSALPGTDATQRRRCSRTASAQWPLGGMRLSGSVGRRTSNFQPNLFRGKAQCNACHRGGGPCEDPLFTDLTVRLNR